MGAIINYIGNATPLDKAIKRLLQRRINMFTPTRQTSYIQSLCYGNKERLQQVVDAIDKAVNKWKDRYFIPECRRIHPNMSSTDIEELCMADKLHNDEGKIELTADFLYGEIEKYGFINEQHRTAIETAWSFNNLEFLRSQWEDTVLEQTRSLRGIAKEMLGTYPAKPQGGQQKTNRPLKRMEDYPDVFGMDICCQLTGYSKDTIYKLTAKNEIPCYRAENNGRKLMFKHKDIIAWMLDRKQETNKEFIERMDGQLAAQMRNSKNLLL